MYQVFVHQRVRGTGTAYRLVADAEERLAAVGVTRAWLACAIGNDRAARFYEKAGWTRTGIVTIEVPQPSYPLPLDVWRYEKVLPPAPAQGSGATGGSLFPGMVKRSSM